MSDLVRKDPLVSLFSFPRWADDWFDNQNKGLRISETEKDIVIKGVVAGVPSSEVDINIEDGVLTIKAEKKDESKDKEGYQISSYQYYYTCALSGGEWDKANAEVEDGVVTITIPKTEAARPRKITVKAKSK